MNEPKRVGATLVVAPEQTQGLGQGQALPLRKLAKIVKRTPAYIVGGFLRDMILDRPTLDIDIAMPQDPARLTRRLAKSLGGTTFPLDKERGIHRIQLSDGIHLDLSKFKGESIEKDLLARDLTINAMAMKLTDSPSPFPPARIIDPTDGLKDLHKKIIRVVSKESFKEDPVRILRAFRIAAELGFSIDKTTLRLAQRDKHLLRCVSKERIREELLKLFCVPRSAPILLSMDRAGVLKTLFPEAKTMEKTAPKYYGKGGVWKHSLEAFEILEDVLENLGRFFPKCAKPLKDYTQTTVAGYPRHALLKMAELLHDVGKPKTAQVIEGRLRFFDHEYVGARLSRRILDRLRFSIEEQSRTARIVQAHMRPGNLAAQPMITNKAIFRFFRDLGDDAVGALLVSLADHLTYVPKRDRLKGKTLHEKLTKRMIERYTLEREKVSPKKLIDGNMVMETFSIPPGPLIGRILAAVQEAQAAGEIKDSRQALSWMKKQYARLTEKPAI